MITVRLPNGGAAQFPDGTPRETMKAAIQKKFPPQGPVSAQSTTPQQPTIPFGTMNPLDNPTFRINAIEGVPIAGPYIRGGMENAEAWLKSTFGGDSFEEEKRKAEQTNDFWKGAEPVSGALGSVAGTSAPFAVGGMIPAVAKGLGMSGGLASRAAFGAGSGGVIAGADTLARGGSWDDAAESAKAGAAIGGAFPFVTKAADAIAKGVGSVVKTPKGVPEIDDLYAAKNAVYKAVDDSGVRFSKDQFDDLLSRIIRRSENLDPDLHRAAYAKLAQLEGRRRPMSLTQLDQLRQEIRRDVNKASDADAHFGNIMIEAIDDTIEGSLVGNPLMLAARQAHSTLRKSEALQEAIENVQRQVAATGSGGNINNALRQALDRLLKNPKLYWTDEERKIMTDVVMGGRMDNFLRLVGKLSPSGNGLMAALGLGATMVNPLAAAVPAAGLAAKTIADGATKRGVEGVTRAVRTGYVPPEMRWTGIPGTMKRLNSMPRGLPLPPVAIPLLANGR